MAMRLAARPIETRRSSNFKFPISIFGFPNARPPCSITSCNVPAPTARTRLTSSASNAPATSAPTTSRSATFAKRPFVTTAAKRTSRTPCTTKTAQPPDPCLSFRARPLLGRGRGICCCLYAFAPVGAQHAVPGDHAWLPAAHSRTSRSGFRRRAVRRGR